MKEVEQKETRHAMSTDITLVFFAQQSLTMQPAALLGFHYTVDPHKTPLLCILLRN